MKRNLTKRERLNNRGSIRDIFSGKARVVSIQGIKLLYRPNGVGYNRILTAPVSKFGNAVRRNRIKRLIRALYRESKPALKAGFDCAFVIFPQANDDYGKRKEQMVELFKRARLFI